MKGLGSKSQVRCRQRHQPSGSGGS